MYLVTENGFIESPPIAYERIDCVPDNLTSTSVVLPSSGEASSLLKDFHRLERICIEFSSAADGRGFSLARRLRSLGFTGFLRAQGNLICDQYRYLIDCGFDEVEITPELAARQPAQHWQDYSQATYHEKLSRQSPKVIADVPDDCYLSTVIDVKHHTDSLFSFTTTRPDALRFTAGEFVMLGISDSSGTLFRAYSIASASWNEHLEFYSIKVPNGKFTGRLQWIKPGDSLLLKKKTTGSLTLNTVLPGKRLFMISTGTGIAPFASLIREPDTYERFDEVILTHTCRFDNELEYGREKVTQAKTDPLVADLAVSLLKHFTSTTREDSTNTGRITSLIQSGEFFRALRIEAFDPDTDRIMICGSADVLRDVKKLCEQYGFQPGSINRPGTFVWERSFAN